MSLTYEIGKAYDETGLIMDMVNCVHMAASSLDEQERDALQAILDETRYRLIDLRTHLIDVFEQSKDRPQ